MDSSSDEYSYLPMENELENYFLNRKMIKEKDYNPVDEDVSDFSITDVSESESSTQTAFSSPEDVLSASESVSSSPRDATMDALSNGAANKDLSLNGTAVSFSNDGRVSSPVNVNPSPINDMSSTPLNSMNTTLSSPINTINSFSSQLEESQSLQGSASSDKDR